MSYLFENSIFGATSEYGAPVVEGYTAETEGGLIAITESYEDQLEIVKAVCEMDQLGTLFASGQLSSERYEQLHEAAIGNFFTKAKENLKKLWGKIKAFFKSLIVRIQARFQDAAKFVDKHAAELRKLNLSGFKQKVYKYVDLDAEVKSLDGLKSRSEKALNANYSQVITVIKSGSHGSEEESKKAIEVAKKIAEDEKDQKRNIYMSAAGDPSITTSEDFNRSLFRTLRSGAKGPEDKVEVSVNIDKVIDEVKGAASIVKSIKSAQGDIDKVFEEALKKIDEVGKAIDASKDGNAGTSTFTDPDSKNKANVSVYTSVKSLASSYVRGAASYVNTYSTVVTAKVNAVKAAVEEQYSANKSIINAALAYKKKD